MTQTLFHAFNWQFSDIEKKIPELADLGFHAVQISPAQQCRNDGRAWYLRYQPYDYSVLSGLGNERELESLCEKAKQSGLYIIADVVFNHMAGVCDATEARLAWEANAEGNSSLVDRIEQRLNTFPQFEPEDFHPFTPISGLEYDDDAKRFTGWGGAGTWPDLRPTPKVLELQKQHIDLLYKCGVRGFRFDAVKQMFASSQYAPLVHHCQGYNDVRLIYGEVLSTQAQMHTEYSAYAKTTDFVVVKNLVAAFEEDKSLARLCQLPRLPFDAIEFSRNHDTVMQFMPSLSFNDERLAALAGAYLLARADSSVLVLAADLEDPEFDALTQMAIAYRKFALERKCPKPNISIPQLLGNSSSQKCLWLGHNDLGAMIVNASEQPLHLCDLAIENFSLCGTYGIQKERHGELGIEHAIVQLDNTAMSKAMHSPGLSSFANATLEAGSDAQSLQKLLTIKAFSLLTLQKLD